MSSTKANPNLAVKLIHFARRDTFGPDAVLRKLLTVGIDVDAAGLLDVGIDVVDVDIEDERLVAGGREPMHVVLVVGDGGVFPGGKRTVDRRPDDHELAIVLQAIVVPAAE